MLNDFDSLKIGDIAKHAAVSYITCGGEVSCCWVRTGANLEALQAAESGHTPGSCALAGQPHNHQTVNTAITMLSLSMHTERIVARSMGD